jgi:hypothetical protein
MVAQYSHEQLIEYEESRKLWLGRGRALLDVVLTHKFANPRAEEYARTGFGRRLGYLEHAMERLAEVYPPNTVGASRDAIRDAELLLQAFVMNIFGAIDNLAWVWAIERDAHGSSGRALRPAEFVFVGARSNHLSASLTPRLREVVGDAKEWFNEIGIYRHGVAHQIPIYIPRLLGSIWRRPNASA